MKVLITLIASALAIAMQAQAQHEPFDCTASAPHRDFDFWLGSWTVTDASGKLAGRNTITAEEKGCMLREQWHSAGGGTGQSSNYYHAGTAQWRQLWVDAGASIIDISGGLEEDSMVLRGTIFYLKQASEKPFRGRWTPLPDGRVRQFFEEQDKAGKWQTWFDGYYQRESAHKPEVNTGHN